jgi:mono/diheme cytochrome c family protein
VALTRHGLSFSAVNAVLLALVLAQAPEALLATRLPCLGCHRLEGKGGAIGPDFSNVGERLSREAITAIIADPQSARPGSLMPRVPMSDATRRRVAAFLASRGAAPAASAPPPPSRVQSAGATPRTPAELYARHCAACHGDRGRGDGWNAVFLPTRPAALADRARMSRLSDDRLFDTIFSGGYVMKRSHLMPGYGLTLTRQEIRGLVARIRTLCRCEGPAWSR